MKNPTMDIERRGGARPKRGPTYTTQTIQEEVRAARTEGGSSSVEGDKFLSPHSWTTKDIPVAVLEGACSY